MKAFQRAETIVCSITVTNSSGVSTDPDTSMKIVITGPTGLSVVASTAMTNDAGTGLYHYDYQPAADALLGRYKVQYTAIDGTRTTIQNDWFVLE